MAEPSIRRLRPLMGTFVEIQLETEATQSFNQLLTDVFEYGQSLEKIFSPFDADSNLSRYNRGETSPGPELTQLLRLGASFEKISDGFFSTHSSPSSGEKGRDLNGVAKGFVVDQMISFLQRQNPRLAGVVNAGGDLRFFNARDRKVTLRLGSLEQPVFRHWQPSFDSVATSSVNRSLKDPQSTTRYTRPLRAELKLDDSVVVNSDLCCVADALTKVGLFANPAVIQKCSTALQAVVMVFDAQGNTSETYAPESHT